MENLCPLQLKELPDSKAQVIVRSYRKEHFSLLSEREESRVSGIAQANLVLTMKKENDLEFPTLLFLPSMYWKYRHT